MRINKEYCITCGGLRSYVEDDPLERSAASPTQRTEVYPTPPSVTATATYIQEERICGCDRGASHKGG
jgi:hypothetical protein